uniref:Calcium-channel protein CCH1 n=1 Tax=Chromera velia CCMP2878 TaxID=1169474 RepID=A0A0G4H9N8_9ALVE|eukprot:Cvel_5956.t1-p1 / transcript=Cvel_5956.t1 / gene=Cvel_5956 / organism=Chromera_velia_CCMP2878 / gene_product=Sodium channel protein type 2 subunit alpha, putative / transcript_product=Sodium channel protein type 2 subunit alpha, putative / location=Cvel_scaffold285:4955-24632(+) / protein_length=2583 / sequence_SO=supercontig / SO=protein_coding / is_pseudo=false
MRTGAAKVAGGKAYHADVDKEAERADRKKEDELRRQRAAQDDNPLSNEEREQIRKAALLLTAPSRRSLTDYDVAQHEFKKDQINLVLFEVHGKKIRRVKRSLFLFGPKNKFRYALIWFTEWPWFDRVMLLAIMANSLMLAFQDMNPESDPNSAENRRFAMAEIVFVAIFTFECAVKVIARGFICGQTTYLRDAWNWLDFIVVITGLMEVALADFLPSTNLSVIRTFRVLRPLRSLNIFPGMRTIVITLLQSLPKLGNVLLLAIFVLTIFAIVGLNLLGTIYWQRCRTSPHPINSAWPDDPFQSRFCGGWYECLFFSWCGNSLKSPTMANGEPYPLRVDPYEELAGDPEADYGYTGFQHFGTAFFTMFQCTTLEGWTPLMYRFEDGYNQTFSRFYFTLLILIGAIFVVNLTVAIMWAEFEGNSRREKQEAMRKDAAEQIEERENGPKAKRRGSFLEQTGDMLRRAANSDEQETYLKEKEKDKEENQDGPLSLAEKVETILNGLGQKWMQRLTEIAKRTQTYASMKVLVQKSAVHSESSDSKQRSCANCYRSFSKWCFTVTESKTFVFVITLCIIANTIILCLDSYPPISPDADEVFNLLNIIFTGIFSIEVALKLFAVGFRLFCKDGMNVFDALIVAISVAEIGVEYGTGGSSGFQGASAFRTFRLLRVLKLARNWMSLRILLEVISLAVAAMGEFCLLLLIFLYIFALIGMQMFAYRVRDDDGNFPRMNFNTFLNSFITVYAVVVGDDWPAISIETSRDVSPAAMLYFVALILIGNVILLNLFLAILLGSFADARTQIMRGYLDQFVSTCWELGLRPPDIPYDRVTLQRMGALDPLNPHVISMMNVDHQQGTGGDIMAGTQHGGSSVQLLPPLPQHASSKRNSRDAAGPSLRQSEMETGDASNAPGGGGGGNPKFKRQVSWKADQPSLLDDTERGNAPKGSLAEVPEEISAAARKSDVQVFSDPGEVDEQLEGGNVTPMPSATMSSGPAPQATAGLPAAAFSPSRASQGQGQGQGEEGAKEKGSPGGGEGGSKSPLMTRILGSRSLNTMDLSEEEKTFRTRQMWREWCCLTSRELVQEIHLPLRDLMEERERKLEAEERQRQRSMEAENAKETIKKIKSADEKEKERGDAASLPESGDERDETLSEPQQVPATREGDGVPPSSPSMSMVRGQRGSKTERERDRFEEGSVASRPLSGQGGSTGGGRGEQGDIDDQLVNLRRTVSPVRVQFRLAEQEGTRPWEHDPLTGKKQRTFASALRRIAGTDKGDHRGEDEMDGHDAPMESPRSDGYSQTSLGGRDGHGGGDTMTMGAASRPATSCEASEGSERGGAQTVESSPTEGRHGGGKGRRRSSGKMSGSEDPEGGMGFSGEEPDGEKGENGGEESSDDWEGPSTQNFMGLLRWWCWMIVKDKRFDYTILAFIVISSCLLAAEGAYTDPDSQFARALRIIDIIMLSVFLLEMLLKWIAYGIFCGREAYFKSGWNWLDFIVVCASLVELVFTMSAASTSTDGFDSSTLRALRTLRIVRALRPLRVIARSKGIRLVVDSLLASIPSLANVFFICLLFYLIFAILGMNFFKGTFYSDQICDRADCEHLISMVNDEADCELLGGQWVNREVTFDNCAAALSALFQICTTEGWLGVMADGMDARGIGLQPKENVQPWMSLYFLAFMVVGNFFAINLFVGVIIDNFTQMRKEMSGGLATESQQKWVEIQKMFLQPKPVELPKELEYECPADWDSASCWTKTAYRVTVFRARVYKLVLSRPFDTFIMSAIALNTLVMCMRYATMSTEYANALEWTNFGFAMIFNFEAILKIFALQSRYFKDCWNIFDFVVVILTDASIVIEFAAQDAVGGSVSSIVPVVRAIRIVRVLRVIRAASGLRIIFQTMINVIPSLGNIAGLVFILLIIFSILGMNLFGKVAYGGQIGPNANFHNFGQALMLMIRCATGESWNEIMIDCATSAPECHDQTYAQLIEEGPQECGSPVSYPFFLLFMLVIAFIMMNLFVAAVLEGFIEVSSEDFINDIKAQYERLLELWEDAVPKGERYVDLDTLVEMLIVIDAPVGFRNHFSGPPITQRKRILWELAKAGMRVYPPTFVATSTPKKKADVICVHFRDVIINVADRAKHAYFTSRVIQEAFPGASHLAESAQFSHDILASWYSRFPELAPVKEEDQFDVAQLLAVKYIQRRFLAKLRNRRARRIKEAGGDRELAYRQLEQDRSFSPSNKKASESAEHEGDSHSQRGNAAMGTEKEGGNDSAGAAGDREGEAGWERPQLRHIATSPTPADSHAGVGEPSSSMRQPEGGEEEARPFSSIAPAARRESGSSSASHSAPPHSEKYRTGVGGDKEKEPEKERRGEKEGEGGRHPKSSADAEEEDGDAAEGGRTVLVFDEDEEEEEAEQEEAAAEASCPCPEPQPSQRNEERERGRGRLRQMPIAASSQASHTRMNPHRHRQACENIQPFLALRNQPVSAETALSAGPVGGCTSASANLIFSRPRQRPVEDDLEFQVEVGEDSGGRGHEREKEKDRELGERGSSDDGQREEGSCSTSQAPSLSSSPAAAAAADIEASKRGQAAERETKRDEWGGRS